MLSIGAAWHQCFPEKHPITDKEWIQKKPTHLEHAWCVVARIWYQIIPAITGAHFSVVSAAINLARMALILAIAFMPLIFAKFFAPHFGIPKQDIAALTNAAIYTATLIGVAQFLQFVVHRIGLSHDGDRERLRNLLEISVALGQVVGLLWEQNKNAYSNAQMAAKREANISHALKCISATVRICTNHSNEDRYCCVSLLLFEENGSVKVAARSNHSGRPVGGSHPQKSTIAYFAAKHLPQFAIVHHFKAAAKVKKETPLLYRELSIDQKPQYESILLLPLPLVEVKGQNRIRKGVVTIDTERPYEFLGKAADILTRVQAYLDLINLMLINYPYGIEPEF